MPSLLRRVKSKMFIAAHRRTLRLLDGEYGSVFKGRSLDFDELRAYVPGDEVRDIDWKATARHGAPLVKRYVAVKRHSVLLLVDTGRNMAAQSLTGEPKKDIAIDAAGVLGFLASRHGDDVGLVHGSAAASVFMRPRSGEEHLELMLRSVDSSVSLDSPPSSISGPVEYVLKNIRQRMLITVVADEVLPDAHTQNLLRRLRARHEVLWMTIRDAELAPEPGAHPGDSEDVGTGGSIPRYLATDSRLREAYAAAMHQRNHQRLDVFRRLGIAHSEVSSTQDVLSAVLELLEKHRSASPRAKSAVRAGRAG